MQPCRVSWDMVVSMLVDVNWILPGERFGMSAVCDNDNDNDIDDIDDIDDDDDDNDNNNNDDNDNEY